MIGHVKGFDQIYEQYVGVLLVFPCTVGGWSSDSIQHLECQFPLGMQTVHPFHTS